MYFGDLNRFLLYVTLVGAGIPFTVWLMARAGNAALKRAVPGECFEAVVIGKRLEVKTKDSNKKAYTVYYMTFNINTGNTSPDGRWERREFELPAPVYALSAEGDKGVLHVHMGKAADWKRETA